MRNIFHVGLALLVLTLAGSAGAQDEQEDDGGDIPSIIQDLSSDDPETQAAALDELMFPNEIALPVLPALIRVAEKSTDENRIVALRFLGDFGPSAKAAAEPVAAALQDPNPRIRIMAATALLHIGGPNDAAVAVLSNSLRDGDAKQRSEIALQLLFLGRTASKVAPALIQAAQDGDPQVRADIAEAMPAIGSASPEIIAALRTLLADSAPLVQVNAAAALWKLDEPASNLVPILTRIVAEFKPNPARDPMDEYFFHDRVPARSAIELLGEIGPEARPAVPVLLTAADNSRLAIRFPAIKALGEVGAGVGPVAIQRLNRALHDPQYHTYPFEHRPHSGSINAAIALRTIGRPATAVLLAALDDPDEQVRVNAANALGHFSDNDRVVAALVRLLDDPVDEVRATAALALERIGPAAAPAAPGLAARLNDPAEWTSYPESGIGSRRTVGDHALSALSRISPPPAAIAPAIVQELERSGRISDAMYQILRRLGPQVHAAIPALERLLDDPEHGIAAAAALARIAPSTRHGGLLRRLHAGVVVADWPTNLKAAAGLGSLGAKAKETLPHLYTLLATLHGPADKATVAAAIIQIDRSQKEAIAALAQAQRERRGRETPPEHDEPSEIWSSLGADAAPGAPELIAGLRFEDPDRLRDYFWAPQYEQSVRVRSAQLLLDIPGELPRALAALRELLHASESYSRGEASVALAKLGPAAEAAAPDLASVMADSWMYALGGDGYGNGAVWHSTGDHAMRALVQIGPPALPFLREALRYEEPSARQFAAQGLGLLGPPGLPAVPDLLKALGDSRRAVRAAAAEALGRFVAADEATIDVLIRAAADPHLVVRTAAARGLGHLGPAAARALPALAALQEDPFEPARTAAGDAMRNIRP